MLLARYPNVSDAPPDPDEGWLEVATSANKSSFTDPVLGTYGKQAGYWVGANLRIRSFSWLFETRTITASTAGGTLEFDEELTETLANNIQPGWGYYLDNVLGELDHENEWYYDQSAGKVYLYAPGGADPDTLLVEGAVYDLGCYLVWHYHDTTIEDLTFRHQNEEGVLINQSDRVVIRNCRFENIGHVGVNMAWNSVHIVIDGNSFSDILEFSIKFIANIAAGDSVIENNTIRNTAIIAGYGGDGVARGCGIRTWGVTGLTIRGNLVENTGYVGMHLEGGSHLVENNIVRRSQLTLDDGGGLFINSPDNTIRGNIVTESWGNRGPSSGTHNGGNFDNNQMGMGIFFMPNLTGNIVVENTFADNRSQGIYADRTLSTEIRDNTCFNNGSGAYHGSQLYLTGTGSSQNNTISGNILVGTEAVQYTMRTDTDYTIGSYDNSVICNINRSASILDQNTELTLAEWQASGTGRDGNATGCPPLSEPVVRLLVNDRNGTRTFNLGEGCYDASGVELESSVTLDSWSSLIVFQEQDDFYSLSKMIAILKILAGEQSLSLELTDIDDDGKVTMTDFFEVSEMIDN